ncbi:MAG: hypothetical protein JWP97_1018 [Labilithrix sp.]|nr:hypothetical protein [Labilithrix sp.]
MARLSSATVATLVTALAATASGALSLACSRGGSDPTDPGDGGGPDGSGVFVTPDGGGLTPQAACQEDNKDVFVISEDRTFYQFHPPTAEFKAKGFLDCPTGGATPTSMAVDRTGIAWVRHSDGSIWKVSTETLKCEATAYQPQAESFIKFGMGFATETKGGQTESLYVSDSAGQGLARLDTKSLQLSYIGPYTGDLAGTTSELTGTGDGKLYGFFVASPAHVAEISKATGDIVPGTDKELTGVYAGNAWAFSFYGGDFYIYTSSDGSSGLPRDNSGSDVTKYSPKDGSITSVKSKIGFKIVGAGVSTCAPTTNVK